MNILLIFFALPIATIILAAVLEKILNCPLAVAAVFFAIYLVVTFAAFDTTFLIATIVYTILAFLTALIVRFICNNLNEENDEDNNSCGCNNISTNIATLSTTANHDCGCGCRRRF